MSLRRPSLFRLLVPLLSSGALAAQTPTSSLPSMSPTVQGNVTTTAPIAPTGGSVGRPAGQQAQVSCANGQLEIHAENSSLNGILRAIARCTGMQINGRVTEQRVFGNYGPAAPATVLATLLDGTGSNMLLHETAADQPAELILTPRTGGVSPPSAFRSADDGDDSDDAPSPLPVQDSPYRQAGQRAIGYPGAQRPNVTPVPQPYSGSAVTTPPTLPPPTNNPLGSPNNTSPTAATYPTTNSVPLNSIASPSTVTAPTGIVDAPNPPPTGSDTAAGMNGAAAGTPGTTNISPTATGETSTPGGTNTTVPANNGGDSEQTTPEQIFQELQRQQKQQLQQQQQDQQNNPQ